MSDLKQPPPHPTLPESPVERHGTGMGGNLDENLRVGQHRVSDHDADNHTRGRDAKRTAQRTARSTAPTGKGTLPPTGKDAKG